MKKFNKQEHDFVIQEDLAKENQRLYGIYMKSHCLAPDFEDEVYAASKFDAAKKFKQAHRMQLAELSIEELMNYVGEMK